MINKVWPFLLMMYTNDADQSHEAGLKPQVVNLACGLDGRAFRDLPYPPDTTIYEIDRQEVSLPSFYHAIIPILRHSV